MSTGTAIKSALGPMRPARNPPAPPPTTLKNDAVLLELALQRYAIDLLMREGFTPTITPDLARNEVLQGTGYIPRGPETQIYSIADSDLSLVATAEITLATRVRVQPFRRAQFRNLGRLAKSQAEHDCVVVAILRGDRVGASAAMRAHIELVRGEYELYAVSV